MNFNFIFGLLPLFCITSAFAQYPESWFAPVTDPHPPAWEVLPQAAKPGEVILSKRNELGILSNFAPTPFTYRGKSYASLEGFWQMMFFPEEKVEEKNDPRSQILLEEWGHTREQVTQLSAFEAKSAGDLGLRISKKLGIDWVSFEGKKMLYWSAEKGEHYRLIREAMKEKLKQNPEVKRILLATGNLKLLPDHHQEENAPAEWKYFQIWMELRSELQHAK